jgi:hypothetical protein
VSTTAKAKYAERETHWVDQAAAIPPMAVMVAVMIDGYLVCTHLDSPQNFMAHYSYRLQDLITA